MSRGSARGAAVGPGVAVIVGSRVVVRIGGGGVAVGREVAVSVGVGGWSVGVSVGVSVGSGVGSTVAVSPTAGVPVALVTAVPSTVTEPLPGPLIRSSPEL
jgi:hypothetical protein